MCQKVFMYKCTNALMHQMCQCQLVCCDIPLSWYHSMRSKILMHQCIFYFYIPISVIYIFLKFPPLNLNEEIVFVRNFFFTSNSQSQQSEILHISFLCFSQAAPDVWPVISLTMVSACAFHMQCNITKWINKTL